LPLKNDRNKNSESEKKGIHPRGKFKEKQVAERKKKDFLQTVWN